jgi:hypothetical protein
MTRREPPVDPPRTHWCAACERELTDESAIVEVRGLTYCHRCWKGSRHG